MICNFKHKHYNCQGKINLVMEIGYNGLPDNENLDDFITRNL